MYPFFAKSPCTPLFCNVFQNGISIMPVFSQTNIHPFSQSAPANFPIQLCPWFSWKASFVEAWIILIAMRRQFHWPPLVRNEESQSKDDHEREKVKKIRHSCGGKAPKVTCNHTQLVWTLVYAMLIYWRREILPWTSLGFVKCLTKFFRIRPCFIWWWSRNQNGCKNVWKI